MKQLSLVAFHGPKTAGFADLIRSIQATIAAGLPPAAFRGYRPPQVHATIAGMERLDDRRPPIGRNPWRKRGVEVPMIFDDLREVVSRHLPLSIRLGGFSAAARDFESRGAAPYERSFQMQLATGRATLIGWPHRAGDFGRRSLAALRADLARTCGIEHKYDDDNDLFVVLGTLDGAAADVERRAPRVEASLRERLATRPVEVELTVERVHVACYESESLAPETTTLHAIDDPRLTPGFVNSLYET